MNKATIISYQSNITLDFAKMASNHNIIANALSAIRHDFNSMGLYLLLWKDQIFSEDCPKKNHWRFRLELDLNLLNYSFYTPKIINKSELIF